MNTYSRTNSSQRRLRVGLIGARGYTGMELGRSLLQHPFVESLTLGINESSIQWDLWIPEAQGRGIHRMSVSEMKDLGSTLDVVFLATPAEVSMDLAPRFIENKIKVIDLSGAFRLNDSEKYPQWYGFEHQHSQLLSQAHYGLIPWNDFKVQNPEDPILVANPGCYATAIQMALIPLIKSNLIDVQSIVIDAKSGTTGAGRKAMESQLFAEVDGDFYPYKVSKHQHFPEICEHIFHSTKIRVSPFLSTTLIPVRRGLMAGIYARLNEGVDLEAVNGAFEEAYRNYPLVRFGKTSDPTGDSLLSVRRVVGSARTHIAFGVDQSKLYVYSSIDNLMKGAASQAIECMNQIYGWPVQSGLLHREGLL